MKFKTTINPIHQGLLDLNTLIHHENDMYEYHMKHIKLVAKYACIIGKKLDICNFKKLRYIAYAHDLFKERSLDPSKIIMYNNHEIPQDTTKYVRTNLDILEQYGLDDYFNTSIQYHALSAGIFLIKEFGITDKEILYPVMFHSCPIISVYETLSPRTRTMIDIIILADKLSSNYLRINYRETNARVDLDKVVFGSSGKEFNYSLGLYIARLIGQGKSKEKEGLKATEFYFKRLSEENPLISKKYTIQKLGGNAKCPKRKSRALMMQ